MSNAKLLTVEDDLIIRHAIASYLDEEGYAVSQAADGQEGLDIFRKQTPDLVITDLRLPKIDGLELLAAIRKESPDTPVIIVSGMGTLDDAISSLKLGAWDYITKPISDMALLAHSVANALEQKSLVQQNKKYQLHLEDEVKKRTAELHQAQKMEAIGTLAGGIAHDFNNLLSIIIGFSEMAKVQVEEGKAPLEDIDEVLKAGNRAAELVKQILTFSRKTKHHLQALPPHLMVKEVLSMLRSSLPTTISIESDIDPDCGLIMADATQIHQIMMNLCTNALHAMKDEKGTLSVGLHRKELTEQDIPKGENISPGPFIVLSISDTGQGMDRQTVERIFDPYFTTKKVGHGTGLGLAVIHGIIKDYHGFIGVESTPGKGSAFHVHIPFLEKENILQEETALDKELPRGNERILVVDDENAIVRINKSILEGLGYTVTGTTNSLEALQKIRTDPEGFDLVITDQTMPGLSGSELTQEILKIKENMPIILCTGFSTVISEEQAKMLGIRKYIQKPLHKKTFSESVRKVLDEHHLKQRTVNPNN